MRESMVMPITADTETRSPTLGTPAISGRWVVDPQ
ncbi:MAG: hypothetical protein QOH11_2157, partial [Solirubrobacteraceae bacterium]|nr:hypothetical protein [Solirubrobacteraceae bacterium]